MPPPTPYSSFLFYLPFFFSAAWLVIVGDKPWVVNSGGGGGVCVSLTRLMDCVLGRASCSPTCLSLSLSPQWWISPPPHHTHHHTHLCMGTCTFYSQFSHHHPLSCVCVCVCVGSLFPCHLPPPPAMPWCGFLPLPCGTLHACMHACMHARARVTTYRGVCMWRENLFVWRLTT